MQVKRRAPLNEVLDRATPRYSLFACFLVPQPMGRYAGLRPGFDARGGWKDRAGCTMRRAEIASRQAACERDGGNNERLLSVVPTQRPRYPIGSAGSSKSTTRVSVARGAVPFTKETEGPPRHHVIAFCHASFRDRSSGLPPQSAVVELPETSAGGEAFGCMCLCAYV
ncbi:hypothetical protein LY78DRAFT_475374 [Colletotrichum sublineola]|nr:hypothetical protein LY78DRAFT_475374 [Colletotrichum sublineola]